MWCSNCQQDVPAIASPEDKRIRCARCQDELAQPNSTAGISSRMDFGKQPKAATATDPVSRIIPSSEFIASPLAGIDDWQWDDDLQEAERIVRSWTNNRTTHATPSATPTPAASTASEPPANPRHKVSKSRGRSKPLTRRWAIFAWCILSLGIMSFVFGCVLLGWSFFSHRQELWTLGLPFALGGQAALIIGLVLQLDGLWQSNHDAAETLNDLDDQLTELRHATSRIGSSHSGPAQSFYFHLAEGSSPHMLLADLKGQLDLLAMRIAEDK